VLEPRNHYIERSEERLLANCGPHFLTQFCSIIRPQSGSQLVNSWVRQINRVADLEYVSRNRLADDFSSV